jgi:hypothetical protein
MTRHNSERAIMKTKLLFVTAFIFAGVLSAHAQSTNAPSAAPPTNPPSQTNPSNVPSQERATEIMTIVNEALTKNGYPGYKITAVAATPSAAVSAAGGAATGTVPPNCTVILQTSFGTFSFCP